MSTWRLLIDELPADGAWNMALDRAIQLSRDAGDAAATLRLYSWSRPTVTLGRFQEADTVDRRFCSANGVDVVRRFTGGRGVLHDDEVTYSMIASLADGIPRGTAPSYRLLCSGLAEAYRRLGVDAALTGRTRGSGSSAACYLHATAADLSLGARKLSGSAQVWSGETVLQHGSFVRSRDVAREAAVFRLPPHDALRLADETATLDAVLERVPSRRELLDAIVEGIGETLGIELVSGQVSERELELASSLLGDVSADRTMRRRG